jgi:hypothetical protein
VSDLAAQVQRELSSDEPQQPLPRVNSLDGDDDDVFESRTAFAFARAAANRSSEVDDEVDDDDKRAAAEDRFFYSHGATRAAGVDVPRSESSRNMRLFNSGRHSSTAQSRAQRADAVAADDGALAAADSFSISSVAYSLWSFLWGGLTAPFVKGAFIGAGVCVVHYLLVAKRRH